jgi:hypothetical protein
MTWFICASCPVIAASSVGFPWPWMAVHHELIASTTSTGLSSSPAGSMTVSQAPRAPTATTGGRASAPIPL